MIKARTLGITVFILQISAAPLVLAGEPPSDPFNLTLSQGWANLLPSDTDTFAQKLEAAAYGASLVNRISQNKVALKFALPFLGSPTALRRQVEDGSLGATLLSPAETQQAGLRNDAKTAVFNLGPLGSLAVNRARVGSLLDDYTQELASKAGDLAKRGLAALERRAGSSEEKFWVRAFGETVKSPKALSSMGELLKQAVLRVGSKLESNPQMTREAAQEGVRNTESILKLTNLFLDRARAGVKTWEGLSPEEAKAKGIDLKQLKEKLDSIGKATKMVQERLDKLKRESFQGKPSVAEGERHAAGGEHDAQRWAQGSESTENSTHGDGKSPVSNP